ncbi:hypothetical protein ACWCPT_28015 [Streptomyces sp. NPDC002308]
MTRPPGTAPAPPATASGPRGEPGPPAPDGASGGVAPARTQQRAGVVGARFAAHRAGDAWLLAPEGPVDPRVLAFTARLAPDPECTVVVADLPGGADDATLDRIARSIPAGTDGLRLVFGRPPLRAAAAVARSLAERLGRTVIAADGPQLPTPGGGLYAGPRSGPGWIRCAPGTPEVTDSYAFPKPSWEAALPARPWPIGRSVAEPVPSGVWLRPMGEDPALDDHRTRLSLGTGVSAAMMTVALGVPGAPALPMADVARFWQELHPRLRPEVRFLCYGPARLSGGRHLGDVLAQAIGAPVRFLGGMPQGGSEGDDVLLVGADGTPGRALRAQEFVHQPPAGFPGPPPRPFAAAHTWPLGDLPEIRPGTHRLTDRVVVEVVRSGLWVRPATDPAHAPQMRDADPDPQAERVLCDAGSEAELPGLRRLAQGLVRSFPPGLRGAVRLGVGRPSSAVGHTPSPARREGVPTASTGHHGAAHLAAGILRARPDLADGDPDPEAALMAVLRLLAERDAPGGSVTRGHGNPGNPVDEALLVRGLRMLPVHLGPTGLRASLDEPVRRWYAERPVVTDPLVCEASALGPARAPGNTDFLIQSVNGRRTDLLDPLRPGRVLFLPGSRFRVLEAAPGVVMMREMAPDEPSADRTRDRAAAADLVRARRDWQDRAGA